MDFTTPLQNLNGTPLLMEGGASMTLGDAAANALISQYPDETPSGADKVKRWSLAMRVHSAQQVELTADDIKLVKDFVAKAFGPLVVGQVWAILDPASVKGIDAS